MSSVLLLSGNCRELRVPPTGVGLEPLVRSSHFKKQQGKHLAIKCLDHLPWQLSFRPFPLTFSDFPRALYPIVSLHQQSSSSTFCPWGLPLGATAPSHSDFFQPGPDSWRRGLPAPHWLEEALLYSCLWLIVSLRPDILQDFLHKQPERLRGTEGASGWNTCSIEVRCRIPFDFNRVRVLPCSFN